LGVAKESSIFLGRFVKAFGIKGELKFVGSEDFWGEALSSKRLELRRLADGGEVERREITVEHARPHGKNYVVKLEGVEGRDGAEAEVGWELFVDIDGLDVDLPDKELPFQVVGMTVKTEEGVTLGRIRSVIQSAAHPVYDVEGDERDVMIPAVPEFVVSRDDGCGEIIIRPIPGLLDE